MRYLMSLLVLAVVASVAAAQSIIIIHTQAPAPAVYQVPSPAYQFQAPAVTFDAPRVIDLPPIRVQQRIQVQHQIEYLPPVRAQQQTMPSYGGYSNGMMNGAAQFSSPVMNGYGGGGGVAQFQQPRMMSSPMMNGYSYGGGGGMMMSPTMMTPQVQVNQIQSRGILPRLTQRAAPAPRKTTCVDGV